jgi:transposase
MKPYPVEFRQKIIEVYEHEKTSVRKLAQRFRVVPSFIQKLLKQYKETGDIRPRRQGGSPPPKLKAEHLIDLMEIIEANPDATLEELCDLLAQKVQVRVSRATMGRVTQKLNYRFKKNISCCRKSDGKSSKIQSGILENYQKYQSRRLDIYG